MIPERDRRAYHVGPIIETLTDDGSVTFLRDRASRREMVTALARIDGRPVGVIANDTRVMAGAITAARGGQGRAVPAAVRRVRPSGHLAHRLPGIHGRARPPRPRRWCGARRACWSRARR